MFKSESWESFEYISHNSDGNNNNNNNSNNNSNNNNNNNNNNNSNNNLQETIGVTNFHNIPNYESSQNYFIDEKSMLDEMDNDDEINELNNILCDENSWVKTQCRFEDRIIDGSVEINIDNGENNSNNNENNDNSWNGYFHEKINKIKTITTSCCIKMYQTTNNVTNTCVCKFREIAKKAKEITPINKYKISGILIGVVILGSYLYINNNLNVINNKIDNLNEMMQYNTYQMVYQTIPIDNMENRYETIGKCIMQTNYWNNDNLFNDNYFSRNAHMYMHLNKRKLFDTQFNDIYWLHVPIWFCNM